MITQVPIENAITYKYPEWVVFVSTLSATGTPNTMPAGWCMFASGQPRMVAVAIAGDRFSMQNIRDKKVFVASWAGAGQEELIDKVGKASGSQTSKFEQFDINYQTGEKTGVPLIEGCAMHIECTVENMVEAGDHIIVIGKAEAGYIPDKAVPLLLNFGGDGNYMPARPTMT